MNKYSTAVILLLVCMAVASCQTQKKPTRRNVYIMNAKRMGVVTVDTFGGKAPPPATTPVAAQPQNDNFEQIAAAILPLLQRQVAFNTFSGKAKMHFKGLGQNNQFSANIRIKKDEVIWINITVAGGFVGVARIYITPDSFQLINYLQKEAMVMPIGQAIRVLPVKADFSMLQNLLVGNALKTDGKPVSASDQGGALRLQTITEDMVQEVTFNKADNNMRSLQMRTTDNRSEGMIQYGNYGDVSGKAFAASRAVNLNNAGEPYYLDMNFSSAEFDKEVDFPFSIPKSYTIK